MGKLTLLEGQRIPRYTEVYLKGHTVAEVKKDDSIMGYIAVFDPIREDSFEVVKRLNDMNIESSWQREIMNIPRRLWQNSGIEALLGRSSREKMDIVRHYQATGKSNDDRRRHERCGCLRPPMLALPWEVART